MDMSPKRDPHTHTHTDTNVSGRFFVCALATNSHCQALDVIATKFEHSVRFLGVFILWPTRFFNVMFGVFREIMVSN